MTLKFFLGLRNVWMGRFSSTLPSKETCPKGKKCPPRFPICWTCGVKCFHCQNFSDCFIFQGKVTPQRLEWTKTKPKMKETKQFFEKTKFFQFLIYYFVTNKICLDKNFLFFGRKQKCFAGLRWGKWKVGKIIDFSPSFLFVFYPKNSSLYGKQENMRLYGRG